MKLPVLDQIASPASVMPTDVLADRHARRIGYLRLSLTKACSMRCVYCRPAFLDHPKGEPMLTPHEFARVARHMVDRHGVHKVRLTGGDPTARADLLEIVERLAAIPGIDDLAMTTNGLTLARQAGPLAAAGLGRINVSLDSLDPERFAALTGVDGLANVLAGLDAAVAAGLSPKLNTVVVRGQNERDLPDLARFALERGICIRFIELMPMGPLAEVWRERYVPEADIRERIAPIVRHWTPLPQGSDAARRYRVELNNGTRGVIGFITPMSCNFCADCNRVRIAADGVLYPCLMDKPGGSLLDAIRPRFNADLFDRLLAAGLSHKQAEHPATGSVVMTHIGG